MLDGHVLSFIAQALPPPPARVLEVGAGHGELAAALGARGWEVVAIDPAGGDGVIAVSLLGLSAPAGSFDAAVGVVSLHHVDPLERSCARLAELLRPGAALVVDEFDVQAFDLRAARWWIGHRRELGGELHHHEPGREDHDRHLGGEDHDPERMCQTLRAELHPLERIRDALTDQGFELDSVQRGPYLYRWDLSPQLRTTETEAIASGALPAVGARFTGRRL